MQHPHLAVEDLGGRRVLVHLFPVRMVSQVVPHGWMQHTHVIGAVIVRRIGLLELGGCLVDHVGGKNGIGCGRRTQQMPCSRGGSNGPACCPGVKRVGQKGVAGLHQGRPCHLFKAAAQRSTHLLGGAHNDVIHRVKLQDIRHRHIEPVLGQGHLNGGQAELFADGDHALCQLVSIGQGVPLAPLDGVAVVRGEGLFLAQLCVDQIVTCIVQHDRVIKGLHGGRHPVGARLIKCGRRPRGRVYIGRTGINQISCVCHGIVLLNQNVMRSPRLARSAIFWRSARDQFLGSSLRETAPPDGFRPFSDTLDAPACTDADIFCCVC